ALITMSLGLEEQFVNVGLAITHADYGDRLLTRLAVLVHALQFELSTTSQFKAFHPPVTFLLLDPLTVARAGLLAAPLVALAGVNLRSEKPEALTALRADQKRAVQVQSGGLFAVGD